MADVYAIFSASHSASFLHVAISFLMADTAMLALTSEASFGGNDPTKGEVSGGSLQEIFSHTSYSKTVMLFIWFIRNQYLHEVNV